MPGIEDKQSIYQKTKQKGNQNQSPWENRWQDWGHKDTWVEAE